MKPYYDDGRGIVIYHGDCREILPTLAPGSVDLVLTDPPYGTGWVRGGGAVGEFSAKNEQPAWDVFSVDWICPGIARKWAIFAPKNRAKEIGACFQEPGLLHYVKTNPRPNGPPCEAIVLSFVPWNLGTLQYAAYNGDSPLHPCQKPMDLMRWLVRQLSLEGETILDPFLGSGTTLVAAKQLGRCAIGIEMEERYVQIAIDRLRQEMLPFEDEKPRATVQGSLLEEIPEEGQAIHQPTVREVRKVLSERKP